MAQSLYSKYRPYVFDDVVGQSHILQTIKNAISTDKISHAYMFCGPRGTGKTTMARLLAKACICTQAKDQRQPSTEFCGVCDDCKDIANGSHADVYELDAASRTGVENVREEIISRVGFAATRSSKKIYIIDEVHMLSTAAFNALLKTLEEPPSHVIFILCTTDLQKVPETILSRCQRFDFHAISCEDIFNRLKFVCEKESVAAHDEALQIIAQNAQGAMRNALTSLELAIAYSKGDITKDTVLQLSSQTSTVDLYPLIEAISNKDLSKVFAWTEVQSQNGSDFVLLSTDLAQTIKNMYIEISGAHSNNLLNENLKSMLSAFSAEQLHRFMIVLSDLNQDFKTSTNMRLSFEIAMSKMCLPESDLSLESLAQRLSSLENQISKGDYKVVSTSQTQEKIEVKPNNNKVDENAQIPQEKKPVVNSQYFDADIDKPEQNTNQDSDAVGQTKQESVENKNKTEDSPDITVPDIKAPDVPQAVDFSQTRQEIKEQTGYDAKMEQKFNLARNESLEKLWKQAFSNIRNKFPAYGAILSTAIVSYDKDVNHIVLSFPPSSDFGFKLMDKPENRNLLNEEFSAVYNDEIVVDVKLDENLSSTDDINPEFVNEFRKDEPEPAPTNNSYMDGFGSDNAADSIPDPQFLKNKEEKSSNASIHDNLSDTTPEYNSYTNQQSSYGSNARSNEIESDRANVRDMLSNFGAYNFSEEE